MEDEEDGNDSVVSKYLVHVLNTEGWFRYEKDLEFISKGIEELCSRYYHFKQLVTMLAQQSFSWNSMIWSAMH